MNTANKLIRQAQLWVGLNERDGSFKQIIDLYNSTSPIPRGYKAKYTSEWCAIFVTCLGYKTGMTDIIGAECSVPKFIQIFKNKGTWLGADVTPKPGDIVVYDWDSTKDGDHIGIIEKVSGSKITAIEGNMSGTTVNGQYLGKVGRREFAKGWSRVTGYARPKYDNAEAVVRLYNPNNGEHFYTKNPVEADNLRNVGWRDEGISWYSPKTGAPVHRLYNPNTGVHFYTRDLKEFANLTAAGWKREGTAFMTKLIGESKGPALNSGIVDPDGVPVYRLYNANAKPATHLFTTSAFEKDALVKAGWKYEGIPWAGLSSKK